MGERGAHNPEGLGSSPRSGTKVTKLQNWFSDKVASLAAQFAYATSLKEAARLRIQCTRKEWEDVLFEAKLIRAGKKSRWS